MVMRGMAIAHSKVTAQGQISVPVEVRKKLGIGPGSVLEWDELDNQVVVRRAGRYTSQDVHQSLFPDSGFIFLVSLQAAHQIFQHFELS